WKMFAPLRRGEPISPHAKVIAVLKTHAVGVTAAALADELLQAGSVLGMRAPVIKRIGELLDELEQAARVERIPDGRYRVVKARRSRGSSASGSTRCSGAWPKEACSSSGWNRARRAWSRRAGSAPPSCSR